jgi:hypothetical protein
MGLDIMAASERATKAVVEPLISSGIPMEKELASLYAGFQPQVDGAPNSSGSKLQLRKLVGAPSSGKTIKE